MMTKLFALYPTPAGEDVELKLRAYLSETRCLHPLVLSHALHRLVREPRTFLPSVYEILRAGAHVLREENRRQRGLPAGDWNPRGDVEINVQQWIERGPQIMQLALPAKTEPRD